MSLKLRIALIALSALSCAAVLGCGGRSSQKSTSALHTSSTRTERASEQAKGVAFSVADVKSPGEVVARVGKVEITKGDLYRWMSISSPDKLEVPEPPDFKACLIRRHTAELTAAGGEGHAANTLKEGCEKLYEEELQSALGTLVNDAWLIAEAEKEGTPVTQGELRKALAESLAQFAKLPGGFAATVKRSGRTATDLSYELKAGLASERIYQRIEAKIPKLTPALIASFYQAHKSAFKIPEERDILILHTKSRAAAMRAIAELKAGKSFASVVKGLKHISQPIRAKEGRDPHLRRNGYSEKNLINAIFNARPGVLSAPFELHFKTTQYGALGFYVYEVIHKLPARQLSLSEATPTITQGLPESLRKQTRRDFVKAYKAKWRARTDCSPGYVVENCRQYHGKESGSADPYVL